MSRSTVHGAQVVSPLDYMGRACTATISSKRFIRCCSARIKRTIRLGGGRYAYFQVFYSVNEFYIFFSRNFYILIIGLNYQQGIADIINDDIYVEP